MTGKASIGAHNAKVMNRFDLTKRLVGQLKREEAVIGGIGRIEGPIIGTIIFFALRQTFAGLGSLYLLMMGAVAIVVMLWAPKGLWGMIVERLGWQILPLQRHLALRKDARGKS